MSVRAIPVSPLASGGTLCLHLHELVGKRGPGPTVGLSAGIHGDESTGTRIVMEVARQLADGDFRGRLLLLPVANPHTLEALSRFTPLDGLNLNHVFPGDPDGWLTEQLAAKVNEHFLQRIDFLLDFHAGGESQTVDYVYIFNDERLSRSFGSKVLHVPPPEVLELLKHTSVGVAQERGVPSVVVELGGGRVDQRPYVERGVAGTLNFLQAAGVLDGEPAPPPEQIVLNEIATIRPHAGGMLYTEAPPLGEAISGGAVLGRVLSPYTLEELEVIRSPFERGLMVLSHLTTDVVAAGAYGYMVGNLDA